MLSRRVIPLVRNRIIKPSLSFLKQPHPEALSNAPIAVKPNLTAKPVATALVLTIDKNVSRSAQNITLLLPRLGICSREQTSRGRSSPYAFRKGISRGLHQVPTKVLTSASQYVPQIRRPVNAHSLSISVRPSPHWRISS